MPTEVEQLTPLYLFLTAMIWSDVAFISSKHLAHNQALVAGASWYSCTPSSEHPNDSQRFDMYPPRCVVGLEYLYHS